ncbi:cysteine-rich CWC family protein [Rhodoferax aquaticus]|uniref:Cysteine-rich CWC family protein n=1 Tax=Rhodoferax aquaticus TaxID=2527691 RepID=A0A515EKP7_9BURK|nr:cysteine-rich CWC family protein [Rhodoferax aquaticus]QDL53228.1 hypothetical protein EXZ61_03020 [Rhodoferax aquaticus]
MPATSPKSTNNASHCPLCGQANQCAMELERTTGQAQGPCWCTQATFPPELLAQVPVEQQGVACICARCAAVGARSEAA